MDDPTGGMWIYLIFLIIPLARIIPRLLRKYRNKGVMPRSDQQYSQEEFFTNQKMPEGTKITVDVDLVLNGKFKVMGFFAKKQIKNKMSQALDEFAEVAKNN